MSRSAGPQAGQGMTEKRCINITVYGRVQGVFYRASTQQQARQLGLNGWVRNRPDGTVQVCACGHPSDLEALAEWCRTGPPAAQVDRIVVAATDAVPPGAGFEVRPTE